MRPNSMALLVTRADLAVASPNIQPSNTDQALSPQWHHPLRRIVTCWQGDDTEPLEPPKAQRLVLTGMDI